MTIKETPCTTCRGTGVEYFDKNQLADCPLCQGAGFMWETRIERNEEPNDKVSLKENENELRLRH